MLSRGSFEMPSSGVDSDSTGERDVDDGLLSELVQMRPLDDIELCFALLKRLHSSVSAQKRYSIADQEVVYNPPKTAQPRRKRADAVAKRSKRVLPKTLSRDEVERLLSAFNDKRPTGLRDHCMFALMYRA